jgi:cysteine desulfurase
MKKPIYLDYNATTPLAAEVIRAMQPYQRLKYGNPSSTHAYGNEARFAVEQARAQVAKLINASPDEIVFTGGGTEANNYALKGAAWANRSRKRHIITTTIEHPAVSEVCSWLEKEGFSVTCVPVDGTGRVDPVEIEKVITPQTFLISVMHANNEVGAIQPIREIAAIARAHGILTHTDAAQSVGKIPTDVKKLGVDLLSIAGHKLYAPKGVGALFVRRGVVLEKFMHGAGHEQGRRAGTENVAGVVGLGEACVLVQGRLRAIERHLMNTREALWHGLKELVPDIRLNGHPTERLPNTLNVSFGGILACELLEQIGKRVAASAGAACHSGGASVSAALQAMRVPPEWALGAVRFSTGRMTTLEEVAEAVCHMLLR